jgi:hypothetical protein
MFCSQGGNNSFSAESLVVSILMLNFAADYQGVPTGVG